MDSTISIGIILGIYFLPTIVAGFRKHHNMGPLVVVNVFLGWTLVGWVVALAMAFSKPPSVTIQQQAPPALYDTETGERLAR